MTTQLAPRLNAQGLFKAFSSTRALDNVSVTILPGESVAIMGPSGSGKSTLMHVLSGIITPDHGSVHLNLGSGQGPMDVSRMSSEQRAALRRDRIGFVFQEGMLLPELTALENVAMALMVSGASRHEAEHAAWQWLGALGLQGMENRRPGQLSGGQAQRVAIARAQVTRPDVVFADEPTGALDSETSRHVLSALLESTASRGASLVIVTHDPAVAARCSRTIRLHDGHIATDHQGDPR
ncbi:MULTISPECIES: ABC transporter ATP-binding protein [Kocuria]|uniref:ABC transporter ATP-binding protein n=1 Tax=Kocuria TaxID=57493 RepID=UPI000661754A|nr:MULTISPECIES: ABC transporter ATP-binding protein [Kocuria]MCT1367711.1 ABC transporter ATP-binding protein [Rothia sp. p3-SID1597]RUQ20267.1 ABC transporter ATP-binding protein [Kocuria sp. HSID16901]